MGEEAFCAFNGRKLMGNAMGWGVCGWVALSGRRRMI